MSLNKDDITALGKEMYGSDFQLSELWTIKLGLDGADVVAEDEDYSSIASTKGAIKMNEAKELAYKTEKDKIFSGWQHQKKDPDFHKYLLRFLRNREDGAKLTLDKLEHFDDACVDAICFHLIEHRVEILKHTASHLKLLRMLLLAKEQELWEKSGSSKGPDASGNGGLLN